MMSSTMKDEDEYRVSYLRPWDFPPNLSTITSSSVRKGIANEFSPEESQKENVAEYLKIFLRIKPERDNPQALAQTFKVIDTKTLVVTPPVCDEKASLGPRMSHKFTFTKIFDQRVTQEDFFEGSILNIAEEFINGKNCLVYSFGTTNAGKTFTIQGSPSDIGVLPRTLDVVFNSIQKKLDTKVRRKPKHFSGTVQLSEQQWRMEEEAKKVVLHLGNNMEESNYQPSIFKKPFTSSMDSLVSESSVATSAPSSLESGYDMDLDATWVQSNRRMHGQHTLPLEDTDSAFFSVWVSFAEIYNEAIFDLLEKISTTKRTQLKLADENRGKVYIKGLKEVCVSSADEAFEILRIGKLLRSVQQSKSSGKCNTHVSVLSFCDLAGSERVSKTGNVGIRLKEASNINNSIMVLGRCINALREKMHNKEMKTVVPFRDSKLTRIFQNFFLGGRATMIVNMSQCPQLLEESLRVLKFSAVAKEIVTTYSESHEERKRKRAQRMTILLQEPEERLSIPWVTHVKKISCSPANKTVVLEDISIIEEEDEEDDSDAALLKYIEELKSIIMKERSEKLSLEVKLRNELTDEFTKFMQKSDETWRAKLKEHEEWNQDLAKSRIEALNDCLENTKKRMRHHSMADKNETFIPESMYNSALEMTMEKDKKIQDLEISAKELEKELSVMKETLQKSSENKKRLQEEHSKVLYQFSELQRLHEDLQKTVASSVNGENKDPSSNIAAILQEKDEEIMKLRTRITELQGVCVELDQDVGKYTDQVEKLQHKVLEQEDTILELGNQLENQESVMAEHATSYANEIQDLQEQLMQSEARLESLHERATSKMEDDIKSRGSLDESDKAVMNNLLKQIEDFTGRVKELEVELAKREDQVAALEEKQFLLHCEKDQEREVTPESDTKEEFNTAQSMYGMLVSVTTEHDGSINESQENQKQMPEVHKTILLESAALRKEDLEAQVNKLEQEAKSTQVLWQSKEEQLKNHIKTLDHELEAKSASLEEMHNYRDTWHQKQDELEKCIESLNNELEMKSVSLKEIQNSMESVNRELEMKLTLLEEMQSCMESLNRELEMKAMSLEEMQSCIDTRWQTEAKLEKFIEELKCKLKATSSALEEAEGDRDAYQMKGDELKEVVKSLEEELKVKIDMIQETRNERDVWQEKGEGLEKDVNFLEDKVQVTEAALHEVELARDSLQQRNAELEDVLQNQRVKMDFMAMQLKEKKKLWEERRNDLEECINKLQHEVGETSDVTEKAQIKLIASEKENKELKIKLTESEDKIKVFSSNLTEIESAHNGCEKVQLNLEDEIKRLESEKLEYANSLKNAYAKLDISQRECKEEYDSLQSKFDHLERENKDLVQKMEECQAAISKREAELKEVKEGLGSVQSERDRLQEEFNKSCIPDAEHEKNITQLTEEIESIKKENQRIQQDCATKEECLKQKDEEINALEAGIKDLGNCKQLELEKLQYQNSRLEKKLQKFIQECETLKKTVENQKASLEKKSSEGNFQQGAMATLKEELEKKSKQISELEERNRGLEMEFDTFDENRKLLMAHSENDVRRIQEELQREKREIARLRDVLSKSTPIKAKDMPYEETGNQGSELCPQLQEAHTQIAILQSAQQKITETGTVLKPKHDNGKDRKEEEVEEKMGCPSTRPKGRRTAKNRDDENCPSSYSTRSTRKARVAVVPQSNGDEVVESSLHDSSTKEASKSSRRRRLLEVERNVLEVSPSQVATQPVETQRRLRNKKR